ncbi:MAG: citryl-CoA lyase [Pseudomonadota bacterium]
MEKASYIRSRIWLEEPEPNNPFACRAAYCHGYDVYGEMLGSAGWVDMIYLLFKGEAPSLAQAAALELLAVALANPGPRDPAVHAAMCAGVGGSPAAAALTAALAVGAGGSGGAREVLRAMQAWAACGKDLGAWQSYWSTPATSKDAVDAWPAAEHPAGFEPLGVTTTTPVKQALARLASLDANSRCAWLSTNLTSLEQAAGHPLSMVGVAAAALCDLDMLPEEGEMLFLLLRLPGAAAHALEQRASGHKKFPFYELELEDATSGAVP